MLTSYQHIKSQKDMKQLEFDFTAVPEVVQEVKKVVESKLPRLSWAEVKECWRAESDYSEGGRGYWLDKQLLEWEKKEVAAGRAFVSKKYRKIILS